MVELTEPAGSAEHVGTVTVLDLVNVLNGILGRKLSPTFVPTRGPGRPLSKRHCRGALRTRGVRDFTALAPQMGHVGTLRNARL